MTDHQLTEAVELLKSRDAKKRMTGLDMASQLNSAGAVALLIKAIQDQSWSLREHAIKKTALAGHQAVQPLVRLLRDGVWYTRAAALQALELIGDISALNAVLGLCKDTNRSVAEAARKAASVLAGKAEMGALLSQAEKMNSEQRGILISLASESNANLAESLKAHMAGLPTDTSSGVSSLADEPDAAVRLQGLRRELKAILRQNDRVGNEDA
ncbi:MAG: HEAT repeat domain-containing protein [Candidatus Edwardsbacteria bacterium]|nr:HEAT repeat domain-containing protein [Candidatus Edwardsbacteria bacterium]